LGVTSLAIVVLNGERGKLPPVIGVDSPTFTRVALPMSAMDPAWVSMLEGRLLPARVQGRFGPSAVKSDEMDVWLPEACPNVVTDAVGEDEPSRKGSFGCSSSSLTTSAGPKDFVARGDLAGGRDAGRKPSADTGDKEPALMTSALTTRTFPLTGAMITGASLRKSLAKLALDMYEFRDETAEMPETPERVEGAARLFPGRIESSETLAWSKLRSGERMGRTGPVEVVGTVSEVERCSGDTRAMGMTFVLSVPAVWIEWLSEKGLDWVDWRDGLW
jgi:hypothetical protein